ncbi:MAG: hypothetical protein MJE68_20080, partial [Proteobacteria bacterium]|nr:hypothetical protein [Pseudomonadota bacterium]
IDSIRLIFGSYCAYLSFQHHGYSCTRENTYAKPTTKGCHTKYQGRIVRRINEVSMIKFWIRPSQRWGPEWCSYTATQSLFIFQWSFRIRWRWTLLRCIKIWEE